MAIEDVRIGAGERVSTNYCITSYDLVAPYALLSGSQNVGAARSRQEFSRGTLHGQVNLLQSQSLVVTQLPHKLEW